MRRALVLATLGTVPLVVAMLVGCSSTARHVKNDAAPSTVAASANSAGTTKPPTYPAVVKAYFDDLASGDSTLMVKGAALGADGSPARLYAANRFVFALGGVPDVETVAPTRGGFTLCREIGALSGTPRCFDYTGIQMSADGRVATFMVDGVPLAAVVRGAGSPVTAGPVTATVVSSYRHPDGTLFVVAGMQNNGSGEQYVIVQGYTDANAHQHAAFLATTGYAIDPGATSYIGYEVVNADFGGNLLLLSGDVRRNLTTSLPVG